MDPVTTLALGAGFAAASYWRPMSLYRLALTARLRAAGLRTGVARLPSATVRYWHGGRGRPVVFVHGFGTEAAFNWQAQLPFAGRHVRVIAPDLPGFGRSERPSDNCIALQVAALAELLDHLGLAHASLVGHSMGGWVSLAFAAAHAERVDRLVLVDAAGLRFEPDMALERALLPASCDDVRLLLTANFQRPPWVPQFVLRDLVRLARREDVARRPLLQRLVYGSDHLDDVLHAVRTPTLAVWGRTDPITPLAVGERLVATLPHARLVVFDDCAHSPNIEAPRRFNELAISFLADASVAIAPHPASSRPSSAR